MAVAARDVHQAAARRLIGKFRAGWARSPYGSMLLTALRMRPSTPFAGADS